MIGNFYTVNKIKPECLKQMCSELIALDKDGKVIKHSDLHLREVCGYKCKLEKYHCTGRAGTGRGHGKERWPNIQSQSWNSIW